MSWEGSQGPTTVVNSGGTGGDIPNTDQSRKRSYAIYTDQHGRTWGANIENSTGDPCGPLEPQFQAPILPLDKFITINGRQRRLHIRYADIILDIEDANIAWNSSLRQYAQKMYGMQAGIAISNPPPELLDIVGPKPRGQREVWEAAMTENKWVLGFDARKPAWAEEFFSSAPVRQSKRTIEVTRSYPDADEEAQQPAEQALKAFPAWAGPSNGWKLSDGSYVTRLDGEDKEAYKARAEAQEALAAAL